jgi:hypothetical protein
MRHSKRDILKTDDIKNSMEKLSIPVIPLSFIHILVRMYLDILLRCPIAMKGSLKLKISGL